MLLALQMGRQQRGDITGMGFEMVRSSVYSAAQMKVSREEMHKAEWGWQDEAYMEGEGRRGGEAGCFWLLATHLHCCHSNLEGFIFLPPTTYLSSSIAPLIMDWKK